jgi:hypothetical protein
MWEAEVNGRSDVAFIASCEQLTWDLVSMPSQAIGGLG